MANVNTTCLVTGDIETPGILSAAGGIVEFTLNRVDTSTGQVLVPIRQSVTVGSDGTISIPLWRNALGDGNSFYSVVFSPAGSRQAFVLGEIVVPDAPTADLNVLLATLIQNEDLDAALVAQAQASADAAALSELAAAASEAAAAASEVAAASSETQATLAALAAGAPIVTTLTSPVPANGTIEILVTQAGSQVWEVVAGAWALQGWLEGPAFDAVADVLADTTASYPTGTVILAREGGFTYRVAASGAVDHHLTTAGGVKMYVMAGESGYNVRAFGAKGDSSGAPGSGHDDTATIQAAVDTGGAIVFPKGVYRITGSITFPGNMIVDFMDGAEVLADAGSYPTGYAIYASGSVEQISNLAAAASNGDVSLSMATAPALSFDDLIMIYNPTDSSWSPWRLYYRAGEFCAVREVSGTDIILQSPLFDNYAVADVDIYKVNCISAVLNNPKVTSFGAPLGLIGIEYARNPEINNPVLTHANDSCLVIAHSFGGNISGGNVSNKGDGGNDYGLVYSNSQGLTVHGGYYYARRHAITTGGNGDIGAIPCRNLNVNSATLANEKQSYVNAADFHGNSEFCYYNDCMIFGSVTLSGANCGYRGGTVYGGNYIGVIANAREIVGGEMLFRDMKCVSFGDPTASLRGVIDIDANSTNALTSNVTRDVTFRFIGNRYETRVPQTGTPRFTWITNRGANVKINVENRENHYETDNLQSALAVVYGSGLLGSDFIISDDNTTNLTRVYSVHPDGNYSELPVLRCQSDRWSVTATTVVGQKTASGADHWLKWKFPRIPVVISGVHGWIQIGSTFGSARAVSVDEHNITLAIVTDQIDYTTGTLTGFTAAVTVTLSGEASIREV